jgi:hypothetical protein
MMGVKWPLGLKSNLGILAVAIAFPLLWLWLWRFDARIFREHGPMENFQVVAAFIGLLLLVHAIQRSQNPAERVFFGGLALVYFTLVILEFDVRPFDKPLLNRLLRGPVRNGSLATLWFIGLLFFLRDPRNVWSAFIAWMNRPAGALLIVSGAFWICGGLTDKTKPLASPAQNLMAEETFETNAALFMLAAAVLIWRATTKARETAATPAEANVP